MNLPHHSTPTGIIQAAAATTIGRVRANNEDRHLVDCEHGWFAVADGIGGLPYGERASECAVRSLAREATRHGAESRPMREIMAGCHQAVRQLGAIVTPRTGIGTTLTFIRFTQSRCEIGHIGDSSAFHHPARSRALVRLTTDHTLPVKPIAIAGFTASPFVPPPRLDRYLGQATPPLCDVHSLDLAPGDRIILCSDGLTRALDDLDLAALSNAQPTPAALAQALIRVADLRGGQDNSTVVIVDLNVL